MDAPEVILGTLGRFVGLPWDRFLLEDSDMDSLQNDVACVWVSKLRVAMMMVAAASLVSTCAFGQGLLVNPSFESPVLASGTYTGFSPGQSIGGWQVDPFADDGVLLLHDAYVGGGIVWPTGSDGDQYLCLGYAAGAKSTVFQDVYLVGDQSYHLNVMVSTAGFPAPWIDATLNIKVQRIDTGYTTADQYLFIAFGSNFGQFSNYGLPFVCPVSGWYRLSLDNGTAGHLTNVDNVDLRAIPANPPVVRTVPVPGSPALNAQALSRDGSTVVGWDTIIVNPGRSDWGAFVTLGQHSEHVGHLGGSQALAYAVSANGGVVVGESSNSSDVYQAFRWTPSSGIQNLGSLGGRSHAYGVSDDGNVVAGYSVVGPDYHSWRWTPETGMFDIGSLAQGGQHNTVAYGVSGDGRVITGSGTLPGAANVHAFRWTPENGMQDIGGLGGFTYGFAANLDGSVITGYGFLPGNQHPFHAFRWTAAGGMLDLGTLGSLSTVPNAISSDGNVIVGTANNFDTGYKVPFVWTPTTGIVSLTTFLASRGVTPEPGWTFQSATGISGDGRTILGNGIYNGQQTAFTVKFPPANPIVGHPQSVSFPGTPVGPVSYSVQVTPEFASSPVRWFVQSSAQAGDWVELTADGIAHDGLMYTGVHSPTLQVSRGPNGWRRGTYRCQIDTSYGPFASNSAVLSFPLVSVQSGAMQLNASIGLFKQYSNGVQIEVNRAFNSGSVVIPATSQPFSLGKSGQTGGGFVGGSAPTIKGTMSFTCDAVLDTDYDQAMLTMNLSAWYNGGSYDCLVDEDGSYCLRETPSSSASGNVQYTNNVIGQAGSLDISGLGQVSARVVEGAPTGVGAASVNPVVQGRTTILTVTAAPGITPASTGLSIVVDATALGYYTPLSLLDDGVAPDAVAGDNVFSAAVVPQRGGSMLLPFVVSDQQARSTGGSIALTVTSAALGTVVPNPVLEGTPATIRVNVTSAAFPTHQQIVAVADASEIGGSASLVLRDNGVAPDAVAGDYLFSASVPIVRRAQPSQSVYFTVSDGTGYVVQSGMYAYITSSTNGSATPSSVAEGEVTQLTVNVSPAAFPDHSTIVASMDATNIGGPSDVSLLDDGVAPDQVAGDYVFTASVRVKAINGTYALPFWVGDSAGRSSAGSIGLTVTPSATGACCSPTGSCSLSRQYLCESSGGVFHGAGSTCGVSYSLEDGSTPFEDISSSGTPIVLDWTGGGGDVVQLPFTFNYMGANFTSVWVSVNGFIQFGGAQGTSSKDIEIPSPTAPRNAIFPLWDFYITSTKGTVFTFAEGMPGARRMIVSWQGVAQDYTSVPQTCSFQVVLYEENGNFEFRYGSVTSPSYGPAGDSDYGYDYHGATIGFQDATGMIGGSRLGYLPYWFAPSENQSSLSFLAVRSGSTPCSVCPGDLNADGFVDDSDFVLFAAAYDLLLCSDFAMPSGCPSDLNRDSSVDDADFVLFASAYDALLCP
jgi:probable HAF family extracellular repeat protein